MTSLDTWKKDEIDALRAGWQSLSEWALRKEMWMYYAQWDSEKWDALRKFIEEQKNPSEDEKNINDFGDKYTELKAEITKYKKECAAKRKKEWWTSDTDDYKKSVQEEQEEVTKKMEKFFKGDMNTYIKNTKDSVKNITEAKNAQIDDLKAQLSWIVTEWPKLREYLSIKRRRLVTINNEIENLKTGEDKENYPKNVLIYLMALTEHALFWVRQWIKRDWMKVTWRRKSDDIKKHLDIIEDKLRVTDKDSLWTQWLKKQIHQHLLEAKQAYVEKQQQSVGLAA